MATAPKAVPKTAPPEENQEEAQPAKSSGMKKIIVISAAMLLLGVGGLVAFIFMDRHKDTPPAVEGAESAAPVPEAKREPPKPPVFLTLEPFTVNLQPEGNGDQFFQVTLTLQVADQAQVELIKLYMPQVRSRLLMLLSSKKASEISTPDGKKKLTEEIIAQVKQPFNAQSTPQAVSNVFFTSFVIQ